MARAYFRFKTGKGGAKKEAPANGSWWIDYRDALGRRRQERTPARTKTEAERLAHEASEKAYRLRKGFSVDGPAPITFAETARRYRESIKHLASYPDVDAQLRLYLEPVLGKKLLSEITPADVDACIDRFRGELAPSTLKGLLLRIGAVFHWAIRKGRVFRGDSPVYEATRVEVPERTPRFLTLEQLERLFAAAGADRTVQLFAVLTGMRKGEVAGLRWELVDLERGLITVRYSYDKPRTKGRKDRVVPIHPELLPVLRELKRTASSPWVFPNPKGGMRTESGWDAAENMKAQLRRAGLVKGWLLKCRRKGCLQEPLEVPQPTPGAKCPRCAFTLWPVGIPIDISFKDLRSTFATHLAEKGDLRLVQRLLGHSTPAITERAYAAARTEYLRRGVEGLQLRRDGDGTPPGGGTVVSIQAAKKAK